jgi:hypothetical protein
VPDTRAYTHDGQRQVPHDRPDIRAQLTGSFTDVDQRFIKERRVVSISPEVHLCPRRQIAVSTRRCMPPIIALVTHHGITVRMPQDSPPSKTARRRTRSRPPYWISAVMSKRLQGGRVAKGGIGRDWTDDAHRLAPQNRSSQEEQKSACHFRGRPAGPSEYRCLMIPSLTLVANSEPTVGASPWAAWQGARRSLASTEAQD